MIHLLDEMMDHHTNNKAVPKGDGYFVTAQGTRRRKRTTKGWELLTCWKGGSSNWIALKDIKQSYPVEVAEYAINNKIENLPAFAWWVPYVVKHRNRILGKVKSKYWLRTHKYGIKIPKSVEQACFIDKKNGNMLWRDAINK